MTTACHQVHMNAMHIHNLHGVIVSIVDNHPEDQPDAIVVPPEHNNDSSSSDDSSAWGDHDIRAIDQFLTGINVCISTPSHYLTELGTVQE